MIANQFSWQKSLENVHLQISVMQNGCGKKSEVMNGSWNIYTSSQRYGLPLVT
jgi:hypothetical protein